MNSNIYAVIIIIGMLFSVVLLTILFTKNYKIVSRFTYATFFYIKKYLWIFTILLINAALCTLVYYSSNLNIMIYIILFLKLKDIIMVILFVITNLVDLYKYIINKIIPNEIVIDNKNLVAFVPAYSETLEDVNNTVNSIINNNYNNENNNLLICIISDGKINYNGIYNNQYYTTYSYTYKSWLNKSIKTNISYGTKDNNKIMIIHKQENVGKKDSIMLVNMLFNSNTIITDSINMKFTNDVLNDVILQFEINTFDYLFCTDADSTISSDTFIELINSIESNDAIASCGIVNVNLDYRKNVWSYLQNFQYLYGQYMRRTVENLFKQILCLPGCITMLKLNKNLAESMAEYSEIPNDTDLIKSTIIKKNSLIGLYCNNNKLTKLPELPNSLNYLHCSWNKLIELPDLPNSLINLFCSNNQLTELPDLPNSLTNLECCSNKLVELPNLPNSLSYFICINNNLDLTYPDLKINTINKINLKNKIIKRMKLLNKNLLLEHSAMITMNPKRIKRLLDNLEIDFFDGSFDTLTL